MHIFVSVFLKFWICFLELFLVFYAYFGLLDLLVDSFGMRTYWRLKIVWNAWSWALSLWSIWDLRLLADSVYSLAMFLSFSSFTLILCSLRLYSILEVLIELIWNQWHFEMCEYSFKMFRFLSRFLYCWNSALFLNFTLDGFLFRFTQSNCWWLMNVLRSLFISFLKQHYYARVPVETIVLFHEFWNCYFYLICIWFFLYILLPPDSLVRNLSLRMFFAACCYGSTYWEVNHIWC